MEVFGRIIFFSCVYSAVKVVGAVIGSLRVQG